MERVRGQDRYETPCRFSNRDIRDFGIDWASWLDEIWAPTSRIHFDLVDCPKRIDGSGPLFHQPASVKEMFRYINGTKRNLRRSQ